MPLIAPPPKPSIELAALRAKAALVRKRNKTPLEDALAADGGSRAVRLVQWAREQKTNYDTALTKWRENRRVYAEQAQDIFTSRAEAPRKARQTVDEAASIFDMRNDSLNVVAALAEFASAQAEEDIFGGDPWFAAKPIGRNDPDLAEQIQKHLQWTFRDGRLVNAHCDSIAHAVCLGECFTKTLYNIQTDEFERATWCLHIDDKPVVDAAGEYVTTDEQVAMLDPASLKGKPEWKLAYRREQTVIRQGVEVIPIHYADIAFREDAPELDLLHTNVYLSVEMSTAEAMRRFNLSKEDALRLAQIADVKRVSDEERQKEDQKDRTTFTATPEEPLGEDEAAKLLNTRVRLIEGYILADVTGTGKQARCCIVFPPMAEDWIIWADYLANVSPKAELPIKVDVWEPVPHKLYGRGFFSKYAYVQDGTDNLWNQVQFRNAMAANPITALHKENMLLDDDADDVVFKPGFTVVPKPGKSLDECIEFAKLPDGDQRSMELMQIGIQLAQLRSGITSAAQGDLSGVPESNTATGIKSLMSRAAVLLKKPIRRIRRCKGRAFAYAVKLFYSNFDREEAFVWGEGRNQQLVTMSPEQIRDLDIDVTMLLTQEQNQTKLEGAQVASQMIAQWLAVPEAEKASVRPLFLQAVKALDFDQADEIVRQPITTIEDCISLLGPNEVQRLQNLLASEQTAPAPTTPSPIPSTAIP